MSGRAYHSVVLATTLAISAGAQNVCRFYLANHSDSVQGLTLSLEAQPNSSGVCALDTVNINLSVGDGTGFHHISAAQSWQTGVVYTAKAVITAEGPQQLSLNGQSIGSAQGTFKPIQGTFFGSDAADSGTASETYVVTQTSLQVANGSNSFSIAPNGSNPVPLPLVLMSGGVPWPAAFAEDPNQATTITATFRFDAAVANPHRYDPYVDAYGQTTYSTWPGKVAVDGDFQAAIDQEQAWLATNGPLGGMDLYGGSTLAGWTDQATGYYHIASHANRPWLISPLGNPLFYIGLDTTSANDYTPITGRESMFTLPPQGGDFSAAYAQNVWGDTQNTTYVSYALANLIRKYGSNWRSSRKTVLAQRISSWGFAGSGKWTSTGQGLPVNPVLNHSDVTNLARNGHPDVWDPNILKQLTTTLTSQIGSDVTNPYIIGWSVGNEKDEVIGSEEVKAILALGASVPAKKALVDQALAVIYSGNVALLAAGWQIKASTVADVYSSKPNAPDKDIEILRQFYEGEYYSTLRRTVQAIDPHHLYLGSWTQPRLHPTDWPIMAANCDVVGFDFYSPTLLDPSVQALIQSTRKPVLIGEYSFPSAYGGTRGYRVGSYHGEITLTEAQSGDLYAQWLQAASANPYVVGVEWFEYADEPVSGRGNNNGDSNISPGLVVGENIAFGLIDDTDRPKYDLINKVRAANIAALQSLGLLGAAPQLTSAPANGATYAAGGLVPGSWAQVKGTNLSDVTRIWQDADFAALGNKLPTNLSGVQVLVNGSAAAVYFVSPTQVSFQVPSGISGTANVQVARDGVASNTVSAQASASAPGIFPAIVNGTNYPAGVFPDGKLTGDSSASSAFRKAKPGDIIALFATGLAPSPAGTTVSLSPLSGVTVTIGTVTVPADFAGLVAVGEFQINFKVPQQFASLPEGNYPIAISINGVSSPATIQSDPPGPMVLPVQH
jgi:uncharacterized protein (TIGR03437 family)